MKHIISAAIPACQGFTPVFVNDDEYSVRMVCAPVGEYHFFVDVVPNNGRYFVCTGVGEHLDGKCEFVSHIQKFYADYPYPKVVLTSTDQLLVTPEHLRQALEWTFQRLPHVTATAHCGKTIYTV